MTCWKQKGIVPMTSWVSQTPYDHPPWTPLVIALFGQASGIQVVHRSWAKMGSRSAPGEGVFDGFLWDFYEISIDFYGFLWYF